MLDKFKRYQQDLKLIDYTPNINNRCACGCGKELTGRQKRWASPECSDRAYQKFAILKGNNNAIRDTLFEIDNGYCRSCGAYDNNWEADHILPVFMGGGACDISNLQTLCKECHSEKTTNQRVLHRSAISLHALSSSFMLRLYDLGDVPKVF